MNFSENISNKLTDVITNELNYNQDNKEIIAYAIETTLLFIQGFLFLIIIGYFFNALIPTVTAAISGGLLRKVSGGAHFDTPLKCLAFGSVVYISIGILVKNIVDYDLTNQYVLLFALCVSFLLIASLAPVDSESKPIHSKSFKLKLKISSMVFVVIAFLLVSFVNNKLVTVGVVLGVVYQSLTLLPTFNRKGGECKL